MHEPDRDALIATVARGIHADDIDFDNLEDSDRADLLDIALDVLDALDAAGLMVVAKPAGAQS